MADMSKRGKYPLAEEGSLWATATPEVRRQIKAGRKEYSEHSRTMENWFSAGCMASIHPITTTRYGDDD